MMRQRLLLFMVGVVMLAIGATFGYLYRDRSANFGRFDDTLLDLSIAITMMDALQYKKLDVLEDLLVAQIEGGTSKMVRLYEKHRFNEGELARCAVTRKARVLAERNKILNTPEKLEQIDYPLAEVKHYLASKCEGQPSHENWADTGKPTERKK